MRCWHLTAGNRPGVCALPRYVAGRRGKSAPNYPEPERLRLEIPIFGKTKIAPFLEASMNTPHHWVGAAFSMPNSSTKSVGRSASFGLLIATTATTLLCGSGAAHSGPCTSQIEQLERQIGHASSSAKSSPTAPQSIEAQLHHQPTPETVRNAERKANADAAAVLQRARQADTDDNPAACAKALDEAKRYWFIRA
jgi:hypothetical protein